MKRHKFRLPYFFIQALLVAGLAFYAAVPAVPVLADPGRQHKETEELKFPTPELAAFHQILHPLVHDALPKQDVARIRRAIPDLVKAKKRVVKAPLPKMGEDHRKNIIELVGFLDASVEDLVKTAKQTNNDDEIFKALDAVHLEFEDLVEAMNAAK